MLFSPNDNLNDKSKFCGTTNDICRWIWMKDIYVLRFTSYEQLRIEPFLNGNAFSTFELKINLYAFRI